MTVVVSHDYSHDFTISGSIPEPLQIGISWGYNAERFTAESAWQVVVSASTGYGDYAYLGIIQGPTGTRYPDFPTSVFTLSDDYRTISTFVWTQASPDAVIHDAWISFDLPGSLSIAAPVPEISTWLMLLLGFAAVGVLVRRKGNRHDRRRPPISLPIATAAE